MKQQLEQELNLTELQGRNCLELYWSQSTLGNNQAAWTEMSVFRWTVLK